MSQNHMSAQNDLPSKKIKHPFNELKWVNAMNVETKCVCLEHNFNDATYKFTAKSLHTYKKPENQLNKYNKT